METQIIMNWIELCTLLNDENADSVSGVTSGGSRESLANPAPSWWKEFGWHFLLTKKPYTGAVDYRNLSLLLLRHPLQLHPSPAFLSSSLRDFLEGLQGAPVEPAITETLTSVSHRHHPLTTMQRQYSSIRPPLAPPLHHHGPVSTLVVHVPPHFHHVETLRVATNTVCFLSPPQMSFLMVRRHYIYSNNKPLHRKPLVQEHLNIYTEDLIENLPYLFSILIINLMYLN